MKAIVFTLDALFALMIAAAGISIILYFVYSYQIPTVIQYSSSSSLLNEMAAAKLSSTSGIWLAQAIYNQSLASNQSWTSLLKDSSNSGGNGYGPSLYGVEYTVNAPAQIDNGTIVAGYGNVYFGASNVIYAVNASSGNIIWTSSTPFNAVVYESRSGGCSDYTPPVNSTALYDGMLIYSTNANIVALNARNGSTVWSANVMYLLTTASEDTYGEPDCDESPPLLMIYSGKIFTDSFDGAGINSDPVGFPLYALYANNGTLVGTSSTFTPVADTQAQSYAIADGQIAVQSGENGPGTVWCEVYLLTNINSGSYSANEIWAVPASTGTYPCTNIATYGNSIAVGNGAYANIYSITGAESNYEVENNGAYNTGVTAYNGHFIYQSTAGVMSVPATGSGQYNWQVAAPSTYGTAPYNATPLQTPQTIYTIWGNGYIAAENLSTGAFTQSVYVPFSKAIDPHMVLAYGRLFASFGNKLVVFGTCQASANSSILAAVGTMYVNNQGSCADYIINSLQNYENTTFTINNQSVATAGYFNGAQASNVLVPYNSKLAINGPFTVSLWFSSNTALSSYDSELVDTLVPHSNTFDLQLKNTGLYATIGTGTAHIASPSYAFTVQQNTWYNAVLEFTKTGWSVFLNGANVSSGIYSTSQPSLLSTAVPGSNLQLGGLGTNPFTGWMTDLQIYNTSLSTSQIGQIYRDGINGPPVSQSSIAAWFPLAGDANGYGNQEIPGYASVVIFSHASYNSTGFQNSFSVSSQSIPILLFNDSTGKYQLYNIGVYSWK